MTEGQNLARFWPHATLATAMVAGGPVLIVYLLESAGLITSIAPSIALGLALSISAALLGSALWSRLPVARDIVFGDLMLWGFVKRLRAEKSIGEIIEQLDGKAVDDSGVDPATRIEKLKKLAAALEARDAYTHGHTRRVAHHAHMIAKTMNLPAADVQKIHTAAAVHDVGKIHVPDEVLNKAGKLTDEEFAAMKEHSARGAAMVAVVGDDELTALVRHHHERIDGRGYPDKLVADEIPLGARIIAVADMFDAITSTRSYRTACPHKKALEIIKKEAGSQLDAGAVSAFLAYYSGRSSRAWWATLTTAPQRVLVFAAEWLSRVGLTGVTNTVAAMGVAAAVAAPVALPVDEVRQRPARAEVAAHDVRAEDATLAIREDPAHDAPAKERESGKVGPKQRPGPKRDGDGRRGGGRPDGRPESDSPGGGGTTGHTPDETGSTGGRGSTVDDVVGAVDDTPGDVVGGAGDAVDDTGDVVDDLVDGVGGVGGGLLGD